MKNLNHLIRDQVWDQINNLVLIQINYQIRPAIRKQTWHQIHNQVQFPIRDLVWFQIKNQLK